MHMLCVRDVMSRPVIAVAPYTRLPAIKHLMAEQQIRRVPVLHKNAVVGIITLSDLRDAFPADATTLSIYELSHVLNRVTARQIMTTSVISIGMNALLAEAAKLMLLNKVSGIPVVEVGRLVGMITESDIFRAVVAGQVPLLTPVAAAPNTKLTRTRQPII